MGYPTSGYVQLVDGAGYPVAQPVEYVQAAPVEQGLAWSDVAMLAVVGAAVGGAIGYRTRDLKMSDTNGCFPGQSRGYKSPNRPDQSWEIMQKERQAMDALKQEAKFNSKGKPGNFSLKWQKNLGAPP